MEVCTIEEMQSPSELGLPAPTSSGPAGQAGNQPSYLTLSSTSELEERAAALWSLLESCTLCPRECRVNRLSGKIGVCRTTAEVKVSSYGPHFGEEPELVGHSGSGTIFFTNCNLWCLFCQNYTISHLKEGEQISTSQLAEAMLYLQGIGCHNINFVTPTHVLPQIVKALALAAKHGLRIPLVYNCGGYESVETLKRLDGIVDIYMPDIKYSSNENARRYSGAKDYWDRVRPAIKEMHRQVGDLQVSERGIAERGLLIRHLVLPGDIAGSEEVLKFIATEVSTDSYVNIMDQYRPCFKAFQFKELSRGITQKEYNWVLEVARDYGLHRGFEQL
jgi:putative pyruvate formate lyase activating enzyme